MNTKNIENICQEWGIQNYTINGDGTVDVNGDVDLSYKKLSKLPLKFGRVTRSFYCFKNELTTLEGCPKVVGGYFDCSNNKLTTLDGCPKEVGGSFDCSHNQLTTLEGCPKEVGSFDCTHNQLTSLEGCPVKVDGDFFWCYRNPLPKEIMDNPKSFLKQINRDILINKLIDEY
jgi:hypothetical protein